MNVEIPEFIKAFISQECWTFAKTMPQWPHWYLVRAKCDDDTFRNSFLLFIATAMFALGMTENSLI